MIYKQNTLLAAGFVLIAEIMFTGMGACVKALSETLPTEMIAFFRNALALMFLLPIIFRYGIKTLKTSVLRLHLFRCCIGLSSLYCFFYALGNLPLAEGMLLKMTSPIFIPLIAFLWLKETISRAAIFAVFVGFGGVAIVLNPSGEFSWVALIGLVGGFLVATVKNFIRKLSQTEPTIRIVFYFTFFASVISSIPLLWTWQNPSQQEWLIMLLMGMTGILGQLCMTRGFSLANVSKLGPLTYSSVLFSIILGYLIWDETLSWAFAIGAVLIIIAGSLALHNKKNNLSETVQDSST